MQFLVPPVLDALTIDGPRGDGTEAALAVLGFSNGGHAAIQFAHMLGEQGRRVQLGFTVDPIPKGWGYVTRHGDVLRKPSNAARWVNVYQRSDRVSLALMAPLKGYPVLDADDNTELCGLGPRGHVHLPGHCWLLIKLREELAGAGVPLAR